MRAMPSPQESTMPVSRTSSCFSYSLICSRMISLISAARIRDPPGGPEPRCRIDHRAQHERAEPGLVERGRRPIELLARRLEGPVLAGQREHGARIALAEAAAHAGAPAPATNSRTNRS